MPRRTHHYDLAMTDQNAIEMDPVNSRPNPHNRHHQQQQQQQQQQRRHEHHRPRLKNPKEENWFRTNLKLKNCKRFVLDDPRATNVEEVKRFHLCACGRRFDHHYPKEVQDDIQIGGNPWNPKEDTQEFKTNAFGEIVFTGYSNKTAKFARLSVDTAMDKALELLTLQWNLPPPRFVILVLGGEHSLDQKHRVNELFSSGIVKACTSKFTKGWIISGGAYTGVMDSVRNAMANTLDSPTMIGITPWGNVAGKAKLSDRQGKGRWPANHTVVTQPSKYEFSLDMNHSHFLLVDDGTVRKKVDGIHQFRMNLVLALQKHLGPRVPFVNVVFKGGLGAIKTVANSIKLKSISQKSGLITPSVLVKYSGGAADVLVFALENSRNGVLNSNAVEELEKMITESLKGDTLTVLELIKVCISDKDLVSVYDPTAKIGVDVELDRVILNAPIQAGAFGDFKKLKLALFWNRIDLAKDIFSKPDCEVGQEDLFELARRSLHLNRPKFFNLFHENGMEIGNFVSKTRLEKLYRDALRTTPAKRLLRHIRSDNNVIDVFLNMVDGVKNMCRGDHDTPRVETPVEQLEFLEDPNTDKTVQKSHVYETAKSCYQLKDVGRLIHRLTGQFYRPLYLRQNIVVEETVEDEITDDDDVQADFEEPLRELFIWAILNDKPDTARSLWTKLKNPMAAALTAVKLLKSMSSSSMFDSALKQRLLGLADEFEQCAVGVLDTCYQSELDALTLGEEYDEQRIDYLVLKGQKQFGQSTCLRLATKADCEDYVSHQAVQSLLDRIWRGKISVENSWWRILLCVLCPNPFLIYACLYFRDDENEDRKANTLLGRHQRSSRKLDFYYLGRKPKFWERMYYFFTAPLTVFSYNFFAYVCFLTLFSYVLLSDYTISTINIPEMVLIAWVGTFLTEEIRQMFTAGPISYIDSFWNKFDLSALVTFFISLGLRFFPSVTYEWPRYFLCISCFLFYVRVLHIFSIFRRLGPLLLMVRKMIGDLLVFMAIIFVFSLAYGVVWHSIMYPNSPMSVNLILAVIRVSYWPMFGEVAKYLDDEIEVGQCTLNSTTGTLTSCTSAQIIAPILLGMYVLFVAVLMFNLLIALFSYRFGEMYPKTNELWSFQRYFLIKEYHERPRAPPPFIIVFHIVEFLTRFLQFFVKHCCSCCLTCRKFVDYVFPWNRQLQIDFKDHELQIEKDLISWECNNAEMFSAKRKTENTSIQDQLENLETKIEELKRMRENTVMEEMVNQWKRVGKLPRRQTFGGGRSEQARTTEVVTRPPDSSDL